MSIGVVLEKFSTHVRWNLQSVFIDSRNTNVERLPLWIQLLFARLACLSSCRVAKLSRYEGRSSHATWIRYVAPATRGKLQWVFTLSVVFYVTESCNQHVVSRNRVMDYDERWKKKVRFNGSCPKGCVCNTEIKCWIFVYRREELCTRCNNASVKSLKKLRDRFPRTHTRSNIHRERADVCGCQAKGKRDRTSVLGLMQLLISLVKLQSITLELCVVTCD